MNRSLMSGFASSNLSGQLAGVGHLRVRHHRDGDGVLRRAKRAGAGTAGRQREPSRGHARCQSVQSSLHFHLYLTSHWANSQRAQSMSQTSRRANLPRSAPRVAWCLAAPLEIRTVFAQARTSSSGTETARCCSSVSTGSPSTSKNRAADLADRAQRDEFVEHPGVQEAAFKQRRGGGDGADAEQHDVGAPAGFQRPGDQRVATHGGHGRRVGVQRRG